MTEPEVSIVIPARNEAQFIGNCLGSIVSNGFDLSRIEVLVVDGMSTDATRDIVCEWQSRHPFIRIIDNPQQTTPHAFNAGILASRGRLVNLMNAHSTYEPGSIAALVEASDHHGADNVGGVIKVSSRTGGVWSDAIRAVLRHPFGVGGSRFRWEAAPLSEPIEVDTVAFGCYRREVFSRVGLFNEDLTFSQDIEFNRRIRRSGGRILLVPGVVYHYSARSTVATFARHNFRNGLWVIKPFAYASGAPVSPRHLVPGAFVVVLAALALAGAWMPAAWNLFVAAGAVYMLVAVASGISLAVAEGDVSLAFTAPPMFALLHLLYGAGSLAGLVWLFQFGLVRGARRLARPSA